MVCIAHCPAALLRVLVAAWPTVAGLSCLKDTCRTHLGQLSLSTSTREKGSTGQLQDRCPAADWKCEQKCAGQLQDSLCGCRPSQDSCVTAVMPQFCVSKDAGRSCASCMPRAKCPAVPACPEPSDRVQPTWDDTCHTMLAPAGRGSTTPPRLSYIVIQARWGVAVLRTLSSFKTAAGQLSHKCPARGNGCRTLSCS